MSAGRLFHAGRIVIEATHKLPDGPANRGGQSDSVVARHFSRRGFLAAIAAGAALAVCSGLGRLLNRAKPIFPTRARGLVATVEADGRLLVTPGGIGTRAPYGCRLNPMAGEIWQLADGRHSVEQIAQHVTQVFQTPYEVALRETRTFLSILVQQRFLANA